MRARGLIRLMVVMGAAVLSFGAAAQAGVVVADFNDMNLGAMRAADGQPADTGFGFSDPHWGLNTGLVSIVSGDLTAPGGTNFGIDQSAGNAQSASNTVGSRARRTQARGIAPLTGTIWFSYLFSLDGPDSELLLTLPRGPPTRAPTTRGFSWAMTARRAFSASFSRTAR